MTTAPDLTFDRFLPYAELTDAVHGIAAAHPDIVEVASIGRSYEDRDIWLATVTNRGTGPHTDKPALWVDANIHATELTGSVAALDGWVRGGVYPTGPAGTAAFRSAPGLDLSYRPGPWPAATS